MIPNIQHVKDTLVANQIANLDGTIRSKSSSVVKSLDTLNATISKNSKEDKVLNHFTYDTIFTVVITLSIFVLGIIIDRFIKRYESFRKRQKLKIYFKYYLDKIIDRYSLRLAEIYKKTYQTTNINTGFSITPPKILTGDFKRIENIDDHELFHAIKQPNSISAILSHLDFIEKITFEIENFHIKIRAESDELRKPMQGNVNEYFNLLAKYVEHVRVNNPQYEHRDEFRTLVNDSILSQQQISRADLKTVYRKIVRPIQKKVVETNIFRLDSIGKEIADMGKIISMEYNYLKSITTTFRLEYRRFYLAILDSHMFLDKERSKIKWPKT